VEGKGGGGRYLVARNTEDNDDLVRHVYSLLVIPFIVVGIKGLGDSDTSHPPSTLSLYLFHSPSSFPTSLLRPQACPRLVVRNPLP
jgi:hypothetical protein